jgi:hypothetical protein
VDRNRPASPGRLAGGAIWTWTPATRCDEEAQRNPHRRPSSPAGSEIPHCLTETLPSWARVTIPAMAARPGLQLAPTFIETKEEIMENFVAPFVVVIFCVVILAAIAIYFPTIYIRKTNKLLAVLEKIESNTRK